MNEQSIDTKELIKTIVNISDEKGIDKTIIISAIAEALKKAYLKYSGDYNDTIIKVDINEQTGSIYMSKLKNVVEEIQDDVYETDVEEALDETGIVYKVGDVMETPIDFTYFQNAAVLQAKNVLKQKLREAEKQIIYDKYNGKVNDIITGIIEKVEKSHCLIKVNNTYAYLSMNKTLPSDNLVIGKPIKVYLEEIDKKAQGAQLVVSRIHPNFVTRLMEQDINELYDGVVEIKGVSRLAGVRSKVSVYSKDVNVDPSGACIGPKGARIQRVTAQLGGERIDVINYSDNPVLYIADAMKPAIVIGVKILNEETKESLVVVADDQFSLAIGSKAQNVNLAVKLTGWSIDIKKISEVESSNIEYDLVETVKVIEEAKRRTPKVAVRQVFVTAEAPIEEDEYLDETTDMQNTDSATVIEEVIEKPVVEVAPKVEPKVVEKPTVVAPTPTVIVPKRTRNVKSTFSELEAALNAQNSQSTTQSSTYKKDWKRKDRDDKEEDKEEELVTSTKPQVALPVYTDEELANIAEEEEDESNKYDDEVDFDEFDEYYDK